MWLVASILDSTLFFFNIYLFIWLCWVLVAALSLFIAAFGLL